MLQDLLAWDGWNSPRWMELAAQVVGAAVSVGLGQVVIWWTARRRAAQDRVRVRSLVESECDYIRGSLNGLWSGLHDVNGRFSWTEFVLGPRPHFPDDTTSVLIQTPDALSVLQTVAVQRYRADLQLIVGAWDTLRWAYEFDRGNRVVETSSGANTWGEMRSRIPTFAFDDSLKRVRDPVSEASRRVRTFSPVLHPEAWMNGQAGQRDEGTEGE